ncbi:hypothetical protein EMPS_03969 [Entomortierella parvispora]|uniref:SWIM-type domain-containing protein n=1 Tax=Entomortierella parvispora TaxID=205924 RepID=A0A9P3LV52_9FUNG|nr:hypothetical protein EMPS_03969 [Entomortierella parvispora]
MANPIPKQANLSDTAFRDLQKLLLELGVKPRTAATASSHSSLGDPNATLSPNDQHQESSSESAMNSDSEDSHSDRDSEGANSAGTPGQEREAGKGALPRGASHEPMDDPDATDSDPDLPLSPQQLAVKRAEIKLLLTIQERKRKHFVLSTIDWETRDQWREQLERKEIIKFFKNGTYQNSKEGYSNYSMVEEYMCTRSSHNARRPKKDEQGNEIPFVPQRTRQPSMKVGCTSTLKIRRLKVQPDKAHAVYFDEHTGHTPRTIEGLKSQRKSRKFIRNLRELMDKGMDPEQILQKYSIDSSSVIDRAHKRIGVHRDDFVTKADMCNLLYQRMVNRPQLQTSDFDSIEKVARTMQDEGYLVFNKKYPPPPPKAKGRGKGKGRAHVAANADSENSASGAAETQTSTANIPAETTETETAEDYCGPPLFAFGFIHPWQQYLLKTYGDSIGLDCAHHATRYNFQMYTIIVRHQQGHGIPAGFMITNDKTARPLWEWMSALKEELKLSPKHIVMDDFTNDLNAFEGDGPFNTTNTFLCGWHILKACRRQARGIAVAFPDDVDNDNNDNNDGDEDEEKQVLSILHGQTRRQMHSSLKKKTGPDNDAANSTPESRAVNRIVKEVEDIMYIKDITTAEASLKKLGETWEEQQPPFWRLFKDRWLVKDRQKKWLMAYREGQDYGTMSTDNFVENWHNALKRRFLEGRHRSSPEQLITLLCQQVNSHFQHTTAVQHLGMDRVDTQERRQRAIEVEVESMVDGGQMNGVISQSEDGYTVKSFKTVNVQYQVSVVGKEITKCSCVVSAQQHAVCKHMYAVLRTSERALTLIYSTEMAESPRPNDLASQRPSEQRGDADGVTNVAQMTALTMQDFLKNPKRVSTADISPTQTTKRRLQ